jgi:hypothetical protein
MGANKHIPDDSLIELFSDKILLAQNNLYAPEIAKLFLSIKELDYDVNLL